MDEPEAAALSVPGVVGGLESRSVSAVVVAETAETVVFPLVPAYACTANTYVVDGASPVSAYVLFVQGVQVAI
jgi:hypothetical protein